MPTINQMRQMLMQHATRRMSDGGQPDDADKVDENPDSRRVAESKAMLNPKIQTVRNPQRMAFPGIYKNPKDIAAEAAARVEPEDPSLKRLFGVSRGDLYEMGKGRKGNLPGTLPGAAAKPKGSAAAANVMVPENRQRLLDVLGEAEKHPSLVQGMDPWYITDPAFQRMVHLIGYENAVKQYDKLNHLMGMASPASDVMTEIPRGTAAYSLHTQGRFPDFVKYAGMPEAKRKRSFPKDIRNVPGHAYHKTAQAGPMAKYLDLDEMTMKTPKVPLYIQASSVPEVGFQTETPVGDAHWSRDVGLADTRNWKTVKGKQAIPGASVTNSEMSALKPWWKEIAGQLGLESVPAQARAWGAFAPQTGVDTPIGAGKLELLARNIMYTAHRLGVTPETARDMILTGKTYAGHAEGGSIEGPSMDEMRAHLILHKADGGTIDIKQVGAEEAPDMPVKEYMKPTGPGFPVGGVDFQPQSPGQQMLPMPSGQPGQPPGAPQPGMPPQGGPPAAPPPGMQPPPPRGPQSNILAMTPQGQAMQAMRPNPMAMPRPPALPMKSMATGGSTTPSVQEMRKAIAGAATSAGMKAPVVANRELTTMQDTYDSLGDRVRKGAKEMQDKIDSMPFKYEPGQHVFTSHSARKNLPPFQIVRKALHGNTPMREDHPKLGPGMGKPIKDPATGKTMRTPYVPGYDVKREVNGNTEQYRIPESAILDKLKAGGSTHDIHMTERKL
jgi:hypothetical protein